MRTFIRDVTLFAAIQVVLYGGLIAGFYRLPSDHYLAAAIDKHARLDASGRPRIIFVGGSNISFSLDSVAVAERLPPYQPTNMGLHGALYLQYMLAEIERDVCRGDIVVISPEYESFAKRLDFGASGDFYLQLLLHRPRGIFHYRWLHIKAILDRGIWRFAHGAVKYALRRARGKNADPEPPYTRGSFNAYGDVVAHYTMDPADVGKDSALQGPVVKVQIDAKIDEINDFAMVCRRRGAVVLLAWPPYPEKQFGEAEREVRKIERAAHDRLQIPILYSCEDSVYPMTYFFDSEYHLNRMGVRLHTERLIDAIRAAIRAKETR
jgi:hypothetical protein